jgi:response regulator RpfG family c-di-GMP phosphodiesterase
MTDRILCVDDDRNILQAYQRALRKRFHIATALGGDEALEKIRSEGPFAVVISDMQMPGMNGVEFLKRVRECSKDTVRMMLTGNADQQTALEAVNEGHIFRFMTKPCPPETFAKVLEAGLEQYRLICAERDLLLKTFSASVKVLTDVLSAVSPTAFGRATRIRHITRQLCQDLGSGDWQIEVAAMLSQIGCVTVPEEILAKAYSGQALESPERKLFNTHPQSGRQLIASIPRLELVAEIIGNQQSSFEEVQASSCAQVVEIGSSILKTAIDFDTLMSAGYSQENAVAEMKDRLGDYDPKVLSALCKVLVIDDGRVVRRVKVAGLIDGMALADDIRTLSGTLVCTRGQEINRSMRLRLRNYMINIGIQSTVRVFVPTEMAERMVEATEEIGEQEASKSSPVYLLPANAT